MPRLLDLFCGAGGCSAGYAAAGFDVVGVDLHPMPNHPHEFIQADAIEVLSDLDFVRGFDVIHASPPCQAYTPLRALSPDKTYPDLIAATRDGLEVAGVPYVIENVMAAPLLGGIVLCGGMFGLRTYRHRRFESSVPLVAPDHPKHVTLTATSRRRERWAEGWHVSITGDVGTYLGPEAMGIDWMTGNELSQAIPPAYTEWVGRQLLSDLAARAKWDSSWLRVTEGPWETVSELKRRHLMEKELA